MNTKHKDKSWSKWSLKSMFSYITGQFIFVRDFGNSIAHPFFGFSITPLESAAESAARLPGDIDKAIEEDDPTGSATASLAKKLVQPTCMVFGIPGSNQIAKTSDYMYKWSLYELKNEPVSAAAGVLKALFHRNR